MRLAFDEDWLIIEDRGCRIELELEVDCDGVTFVEVGMELNSEVDPETGVMFDELGGKDECAAEPESKRAAANISADAVTLRSDDVKI